MRDYAAYVPYVNRPDLLKKAIASMSDLKERMVIIDNSKDGLELEHGDPPIIRPPVPLTFSQTMNLLASLTKQRGTNICIWAHNDAEAGPGTCLKLLELARQYTEEGRKWGVLWTNYDALSAINTDAVDDIGGWDTNIIWYTADNDAYYRLKLAGWECIDTRLEVKHSPSQTLNSDPEIAFNVNVMIPIRDFYYEQKHGGRPGHEKFTTPFNR